MAPEWIDHNRWAPRHNIAPRSYAPVIRRKDAEATESQLTLHTMRWTLVPHWTKFEDKSLSTFNARSESLIEGGGMWNSIKGKKRCVALCQGYFEWQKKGKDRLPHFIKHKDGHTMLLAGLYDSVILEGILISDSRATFADNSSIGETTPLWTFTIVTTPASKTLSWLHDRQPLILRSQSDVDTWLDTSSQKWTPELVQLLQPYEDDLQCYAVPKEVGKVGTESATFIEPVAERKDGIQAMFSRQAASGSPTKSKVTTSTKGKVKQGKVKQETVGEKRKRVEPLSSKKARPRRKAAIKAESDDDEIICLDGPPPPPGKKVKAE